MPCLRYFFRTAMANIRKAKETDRNNVALCIAEGFEKDFSILCKDNQDFYTLLQNKSIQSKFSPFAAVIVNILNYAHSFSDETPALRRRSAYDKFSYRSGTAVCNYFYKGGQSTE